MDFKVRQIDWNNKNKEGIPYDFLDIMKYFNRDLKNGKYPYVPRKNDPITKKEIKEIWIPGRKGNISYVAEDNLTGKVIGSIRINKKTGITNITKSSSSKIGGVGIALTKKAITEALSKGVMVLIRTSIFNTPAIRIMEKLGYGKGKLIKNFEVYRNNIEGSNFNVYQWIIK